MTPVESGPAVAAVFLRDTGPDSAQKELAMAKTKLTEQLVEVVHLMAVTIVNDFIFLGSVLLGGPTSHERLKPWWEKNVLGQMPAGWEDSPMAKLWDGRLQGEAAVNALIEEICKCTQNLSVAAAMWEAEWINCRNGQAVQWNGQTYSSGYGGLLEVMEVVAAQLPAREDYQQIWDCLREAEGDADILDLLAACEQEHAALLAKALSKEDTEDSSVFLGLNSPEVRRLWEPVFGTYARVKSALEKHPKAVQIQEGKTPDGKKHARRSSVHVGQLIAWLSAIRATIGSLASSPVDIHNPTTWPAGWEDAVLAELERRDAEAELIRKENLNRKRRSG
jgi:hypothetical protein